jgi:prohibitin 2
MSGSPKEQWERLQVILRNRAQRNGGFRFPGGAPGGGLTRLGGLFALGALAYGVSLALFNGMLSSAVDLESTFGSISV